MVMREGEHPRRREAARSQRRPSATLPQEPRAAGNPCHHAQAASPPPSGALLHFLYLHAVASPHRHQDHLPAHRRNHRRHTSSTPTAAHPHRHHTLSELSHPILFLTLTLTTATTHHTHCSPSHNPHTHRSQPHTHPPHPRFLTPHISPMTQENPPQVLPVIATRAGRQVTLAPDKVASRLIQSKFNVFGPQCLFLEIRAVLISSEKSACGQHGLLFVNASDHTLTFCSPPCL
ncbi:hypothetical protein E2C01_023378 [Portunus trituberculatus]|uniref:Uncharacterized protein n=1 Tax=Portunus trituberculatus TaxID=210409 RepID=A0A5B7E9M3_PORTR|nr:hypothetical protein [Portunus trituberculatus]